ncbi:MAG: hypothetical protein JOZ43_00200 [Acidobacteriales bacterium]|nr:hypothetical protein [Terriglobales bacterium]
MFNFSSPSCRQIFVCIAALALSASSCRAQATANLNVTMNVQSTISLTFQNLTGAPKPGACALTNAGTNNVGLDLGTAFFIFTTSPCATFTFIPGGFQESSQFAVQVNKTNSSSANYRLQASLSTPPPANVKWLINSDVLGTTPVALTGQAANAYGAQVTQTLAVQVGFFVPAQTLQETITFVATAN